MTEKPNKGLFPSGVPHPPHPLLPHQLTSCPLTVSVNLLIGLCTSRPPASSSFCRCRDTIRTNCRSTLHPLQCPCQPPALILIHPVFTELFPCSHHTSGARRYISISALNMMMMMMKTAAGKPVSDVPGHVQATVLIKLPALNIFHIWCN